MTDPLTRTNDLPTPTGWKPFWALSAALPWPSPIDPAVDEETHD